MLAILRQQQRPVEIDESGTLRDECCRCHGERCCDHAADHRFEVAPLRAAQHRQRLGEPARLVELNIHLLIEPDEPRHAFDAMRGFVGAKRDGAIDAAQGFILLRG